MKNPYRIDLLLILFLAIVGLGMALLGWAVPPIRTFLGILLVFILPGYAFFSALFPERSPWAAESLLIIFGSSVVLTILVGFCLYLFHQPLFTRPWMFSLSVIVIAGCLVSFLRRRGPFPILWGSLPRLRLQSAILLTIAVLLGLGAMSLATSPITNPAHLQGYTILWILPAQNNAPGALRLGIQSDEFKTTSYNLQVTINGQIVKTWQNISLSPGQSWEASLQESNFLSVSTPIQAFLYKTDSPNVVYRQVKLVSNQ